MKANDALKLVSRFNYILPEVHKSFDQQDRMKNTEILFIKRI